MAVRSGAGTGVVVSLVVFIITTMALLVLAIVFYAGKEDERERRVSAENALAEYVKPAERNTDLFKSLEQGAKSNNQSVTGYVNSQYESLKRFVDGRADASMAELQSRMKNLGVGENAVVRTVFQDTANQLRAATSETQSLNEQVQTLTNQLAERDAQIAQLRASHQTEMEGVQAQIAGYREASEQYNTQVEEAMARFEQAKETLENTYRNQISELEGERDRLEIERVSLIARIDDLEAKLEKDRLRSSNSALLVDGRIIDAPGADDQVFIDKGSKQRVALGLTFEVYEDENALKIDPRTGELPRGKASLQVVQVGETTSRCKITRATPSRPVLRNDIIVNAVYDPTYKYKFLVHGKFDVDQDGKPTEQEAEYLRSLVMDWGGVTVSGETLPGDLDFLVLGEEPPVPAPLPPDASEVLINDWVRRMRAVELYRALLGQATNAQIPVLNANRFFVLIGRTNR